MAGTISQTLHRLHLGRRKTEEAKQESEDVKKEDADAQGSGSHDGALPESPLSNGSPSVNYAQETDSGSERRSSWSFHFHKSRKATKQPPAEFVCPISKSLMADPVIVASGESYERVCIQIWLQHGNCHCFKTGQPLQQHNLTPNIALRTAIQTWCGKHKVPSPQAPTAQHAAQLVEGITRTAFVSDGSDDPPTPSPGNDGGRPGFNSDRGDDGGRPGFNSDRGDDGGRTGFNSDRGDDGGRPGFNSDRGDDGGRPGFNSDPVELSPPNSSGGFEVEGPMWASGQPERKDGPLWKRPHSRMRSSGSTDGSQEFPSSAENSGNGRLWHGSSEHGHDSSEWPRAQHPRYVHSASANTLRENLESVHGRRRTPLPLETTPDASYRQDGGCADGQIQEGEEGIENDLIQKLQHPQPLEQEEGAAEIRRLTRNTEPDVDYRVALCTPGILAALLPLLQSRYVNVQVNAVAAMMNLSLTNENKVKIARAGVVPSLIELLKGRCEAAQEHAAGALFSLALNDENKMAIGVLGAIPPLIHVLRSAPPGTQRDAAMALYHLSFAHINRSKLIKAGAVPILLQILQEATPDLVSRALLILSNLATVPEGRSAIGEAHGVSVLVRLLSAGLRDDLRSDVDSESSSRGGLSDWAAVREHAAAALMQLSNQNLRFKGLALQAGAIEPLVALQERGTPRARDKATALLNILRESNQNNGGEALYTRAAYQRRVTTGNSHGTGSYASGSRPDSAQF